MNKAQQQRYNRILPDGKPKYVRCYDNGGKTFDRYTVVFTGNYNNIGQKKRESKPSIFYYVGMSANPFHPQGFGQHGESERIIDKPSYKHLGKKIKFEDLPEDCKKLVLDDYKSLWNLDVQDWQNILNENDFKHIKVIDRDTVECLVDEEITRFSRYDKLSGHPLSGLAHFGAAMGDHRMISQIAEDMEEVFKLIKNENT